MLIYLVLAGNLGHRLQLDCVDDTSKISPKLYVSREKKQQQKRAVIYKTKKIKIAESKNIKEFMMGGKKKLKKASECLLQECGQMSRWMEKKGRKLWKLRKSKHYSYESPVVIFCVGINKFQSSKLVSLFRPSQETNPLLMLL